MKKPVLAVSASATMGGQALQPLNARHEGYRNEDKEARRHCEYRGQGLPQRSREGDCKSELKHIGGSQSDSWNKSLINQAAGSVWLYNASPEERTQKTTAAVAGLIGIGPSDELEAMLAAQLVAAHNAAMECYRRAMLGEQTYGGWRESLAQANKLSRTYAALTEALNRHRGKGHQKVTVEHVHVHAGGQAVVGVVGTPGGGDGYKFEEQPHAKKIANSPEQPLWSPDASRDTVPVTRDEERPLPHARRPVSRRATGE